MDAERFLQAVDTVIIEARDRQGIGRLCEKVVHAALKLYLESDRTCHEVKVGSMVADVKNHEGIFEIQTGSFTPLKKKLEAFLPLYPVTVVYPMPYRKRLIWIDQDGSFSNPRTCPQKRQVMKVFGELVKILPFLTHENFTFRLVLLDMDEYRLLNRYGGKRHSVRYERIPTALREEIVCRTPADYAALLPDTLPEEFDSKSFERAVKLKGMAVSAALKVLCTLGVFERRKEGRGYLYRMNPNLS